MHSNHQAVQLLSRMSGSSVAPKCTPGDAARAACTSGCSSRAPRQVVAAARTLGAVLRVFGTTRFPTSPGGGGCSQIEGQASWDSVWPTHSCSRSGHLQQVRPPAGAPHPTFLEAVHQQLGWQVRQERKRHDLGLGDSRANVVLGCVGDCKGGRGSQRQRQRCWRTTTQTPRPPNLVC